MKNPFYAAGSALLIFFTFFFSSCQKSDSFVTPVPAFKIMATTPENQQENSPFDGSISVVLDKLLDTSRYSVSFAVQQNDSLVHGTVAVVDSAVFFLPSAQLAPSSTYTAAFFLLAKGEKTSPVLNFNWQFTTKAPDAYLMTQRSARVTDFVRDGSMNMQLGDYFYSFGGWTDNGGEVTYNDVYRAKGDLSTWEKMPDAPWHPRHVFGCVKKDGKVWVMGGDNLDASWDVWNSADGLSWTKIGASNPSAVDWRIYAAYCTHKIGNKEWLYIIGGLGHKDVLRSPDGITWETVATNVAMLGSSTYQYGEGFSGAAVSYYGNLYLVCGGGGVSDGPPRKTVYRSTNNGATWQQMPDFPGAPRRYTNATVFDGKIWIVGGWDDTGVGNLPDVWYMTKDGAWHQYPTPPAYVGRHATGVEVYNNRLVITCGNYNNDCWVIEKVQ